MSDRTATTRWTGDLASGSGTIDLDTSGAASLTFSLPSRAGDVGGQTNPEELIAAAHSACYSMQLSALLSTEGSVPGEIRTSAVVTQGLRGGAYLMTGITLHVQAQVEGISEEDFLALAEKTKEVCAVSVALAGVDITLDARLTPAD